MFKGYKDRIGREDSTGNKRVFLGEYYNGRSFPKVASA